MRQPKLPNLAVTHVEIHSREVDTRYSRKNRIPLRDDKGRLPPIANSVTAVPNPLQSQRTRSTRENPPPPFSDLIFPPSRPLAPPSVAIAQNAPVLPKPPKYRELFPIAPEIAAPPAYETVHENRPPSAQIRAIAIDEGIIPRQCQGDLRTADAISAELSADIRMAERTYGTNVPPAVQAQIDHQIRLLGERRALELREISTPTLQSERLQLNQFTTELAQFASRAQHVLYTNPIAHARRTLDEEILIDCINLHPFLAITVSDSLSAPSLSNQRRKLALGIATGIAIEGRELIKRLHAHVATLTLNPHDSFARHAFHRETPRIAPLVSTYREMLEIFSNEQPFATDLANYQLARRANSLSHDAVTKLLRENNISPRQIQMAGLLRSSFHDLENHNTPIQFTEKVLVYCQFVAKQLHLS